MKMSMYMYVPSRTFPLSALYPSSTTFLHFEYWAFFLLLYIRVKAWVESFEDFGNGGAWSHQPYMFENLTFCMEAIQICPGFLFPPLSTIILMTLIPPVVSLYFIAIPPAIVLPYQIVNNHKYHAAVHYLQLKFLWGLFRYYWNIYSNSLKKQINSCKFIKMLLRMNFTKVKYL